MRIILLFVLNAGLNLGFGLAVAALLGPADYGRFAIAMTASVVLATGGFDWLRLSATRFYGENRRASEPDLRATLDASYLTLAVVTLGALAMLVAVGATFGLGAALLASATVAGIANARFDLDAALARARFHDRAYARLICVKNAAVLAFGLGAAILFKDASAVLAGVALSATLAIILVRSDLSDRGAGLRRASAARVRSFAVYGVPVVAANVVFQLITLTNRSAAAALGGYGEAGQLSLPTDLGLRLFLAVGAAVDVFVFQLAVRREAEEGTAAAGVQLRLNAVIVVGIMSLLGVGYAAALPAFETLLVPARYHETFAPLSLILLPGLVLFCIAQFAINPVFQMAARTWPVILSAMVTLTIDATGLWALPQTAGVLGIAAVHSVSLAAGAFAILALALRTTNVLRWDGDLGRVLLAAAAVAAVLWPARALHPVWLALAVQAISGVVVFGAVIWLLDVAGLRAFVAARLRPFRFPAVRGT